MRQEEIHHFQARNGRSDFAVYPVISPQGNIKWLKVKPDNCPSTWLNVEWREAQGRRVAITAVDLTTERARAGAKFLKDAYFEEGWPEGWEVYKQYLHACFHRTVVVKDQDGNDRTVTQKLDRPRDDMSFPEHLLPRAVDLARMRTEEASKAIEWKPPTDIKRPEAKTGKGEK